MALETWLPLQRTVTGMSRYGGLRGIKRQPNLIFRMTPPVGLRCLFARFGDITVTARHTYVPRWEDVILPEVISQENLSHEFIPQEVIP